MDMTMSSPDDMLPNMTRLIKNLLSIFNEYLHILDELKGENFDIGLCAVMPLDCLILRYLELPVMNWMSYTPYLIFSIFSDQPMQNTYALPAFAFSADLADRYETTHMIFRMGNTMPTLIMGNLLPRLLTNDNFPPALHGDVLRSHPRSIFYGYGFEGLSDPVHQADNVVRWYP
jgi:hypothetical protein